MLRLLVALALGANTQAFVVAPQHRLSLRSCSRGRTTSPVAAGGSRDGPVRLVGRGRRTPPSWNSLAMRAARSGAEVSIEGADGETRRVKRSRRPDLSTVEGLSLQAAALAATGATKDESKVDLNDDFWGTSLKPGEVWTMEDELEAMAHDTEMKSARQAIAEGTDEKQTELEEGEVVIKTIAPDDFFDQHTRIFLPVDGLMVKKTYGFWTWQFFGFIFTQNYIRRLVRKGFSVKKTTMPEIRWEHVVTEPEHLKELKAFCCENCGYTLYPARGRHEHFFGEVSDFTCPECDSPRSSFYDANDPDDPHNKKAVDGEGVPGGDGGVDGGGAEASREQGAAPTIVASAQQSGGSVTPPEKSDEKSGEQSSEGSNPADRGGDSDDDLLDF